MIPFLEVLLHTIIDILRNQLSEGKEPEKLFVRGAHTYDVCSGWGVGVHRGCVNSVHIQGDHSGSAKPRVDIDVKVGLE